MWWPPALPHSCSAHHAAVHCLQLRRRLRRRAASARRVEPQRYCRHRVRRLRILRPDPQERLGPRPQPPLWHLRWRPHQRRLPLHRSRHSLSSFRAAPPPLGHYSGWNRRRSRSRNKPRQRPRRQRRHQGPEPPKLPRCRNHANGSSCSPRAPPPWGDPCATWSRRKPARAWACAPIWPPLATAWSSCWGGPRRRWTLAIWSRPTATWTSPNGRWKGWKVFSADDGSEAFAAGPFLVDSLNPNPVRKKYRSRSAPWQRRATRLY